MASRKKATAARARRYTLPEREKILKYVEDVNAQKGRGGQTAAVEVRRVRSHHHFVDAEASSTPLGDHSASSNGTGGKLAKLAAIHSAIVAKEKEIASLQAQFDKLKASI